MPINPTAATSTRTAARCTRNISAAWCASINAHLGLAHDGDADRVLLCDENGTLIDGDDILAIIGLEGLAAGT
jgi:phosphomannomutase